MGYIRYTQQELSDARNTDMIDFLERYKGFHFKSVGNTYRCQEHNSLTIGNDRKRWYWNSQKIGGNNVLDWLQSVERLDFKTACSVVISKGSYDSSNFKRATSVRPPGNEHKQLSLPPVFQGRFNRVFAYLNKTRNINPEIINYCMKNKILYQDTNNNAVFVGFNENGIPAFAEKRGTLTNVSYRGNISGSDKNYSFHIDSLQPTDRVYVFEAPIDLLAHCTLNNEKARIKGNPCWQRAFLNHNRLSLSGTSLVALDAYLQKHKEIRNITVCTDNDEAGKICADKIMAKYKVLGYSVVYLPTKIGKDYAEYLDIIKHGSKSQQPTCSQQSCKIKF